MCGIFLWVSKSGVANLEVAAKALRLQTHRGPDNDALLSWDGENSFQIHKLSAPLPSETLRAKVILGNNRLAINDPADRANQPMCTPDGRTTVTFNGCIFNFVELRNLLVGADGLKTTGDTEVLLHWLNEKGVAGIRDLNGAWAFAYLDKHSGRIILSRDRYGERPLYYYQDEDQFIAASEIKTIYSVLGNPVRNVDPEHLLAFLAFSKWPLRDGERTLYRYIKRLEAGNHLLIDSHRLSVERRSDNTIDTFMKGAATVEEIPDAVRQAVEIRLRADAKVGVLFSGGIDSTYIGALTRQLSQSGACPVFYTANLPNLADLDFARIAARHIGADLVEIPYDIETEALARVQKLGWYYDQPVPIQGTTYGMNVIYEAIARDGVRVVLDGTGGDEIFAGYKGVYVHAAIRDSLLSGNLREATSLLRMGYQRGWIDHRASLRYALFCLTGPMGGNPWRHFSDAIHPAWRNLIRRTSYYYPEAEFFGRSLRKVQEIECVRGRLPDFTAYADANSMMHSVENRSPFLDVNLARFVNLPAKDKYGDGFNKVGLRRAAAPLIGDDVAWRREKTGAPSPAVAFFHRNRQILCDDIRQSSVLNDLFAVDDLLQRLGDHPFARPLILNMHAVAMLERTFPCQLARS